MKVVKVFHGTSERTERELLASRAVDDACKRMRNCWPWATMEFSIGKDMADKINIPLTDYSFDIKDRKAMLSYIIQRMFLYYIRKNGFSMPNKKISAVIERIIANRAMVKNDFSDELSYYYYLLLTRKSKHIKDINEFLDVSSSWLSFYGVDEYNASMFRDMVRELYKIESSIGKPGSEFLAYLKTTGLKENVYQHADEIAKKYYDITKTKA